MFFFFFFNTPPTTEIYTLSLHDALPILIPMLCVTIFVILVVWFLLPRVARLMIHTTNIDRKSGSAGMPRPISYAVFCLKKKKRRRREDRLGKILELYGLETMEWINA